MSSCVNDLYDYKLVKRCSESAIISLKINFHKQSISKDGYRSECEIGVQNITLKLEINYLSVKKLYS